MTPQQPIPNSHSPNITHYAADDGYRAWIVFAIIVVAIAGAAFALAADPPSFDNYQVTDLPSLGGTNSRGNSINNRDWIGG